MQMVARTLGERVEAQRNEEPLAVGVEAQEMIILGRILALRDWGYSLEADPRHSEILCASMGFQMGSKEVATHGVLEEDDEDRSTSTDVTQFQSLTMRAAYLSLDRPELLHAMKEFSRRIREPTQGDWN